MLKALSTLLLILLLSAGNVIASPLNIDACRFRGEDDNVFLELYLEIPRCLIVHLSDSSGWSGTVSFTTDITSEGILLARDSWRISDLIKEPGDIDSLQKIVDVRVYKLTPGWYKLDVTAVDSISQKNWTESLQVEVVEFSKDKLTASDIELAGYLLPAGIMDKYDRGEFTLVPTPNLVFGRHRPYFFYYMEIYPPGVGEAEYDLTIQRAIMTEINDSQYMIETLPDIVHSNRSEAFADVDSVSLEGLPTGSYTLVLQVLSSKEDTTLSAKRFWVMRPDLVSRTLIPAESTSTYDSLSIEREFRAIDILLSNSEIKRARMMTVADKARFLNVFWRRYDDDKSTPEVPFRDEFRQRVAEADRRWDNFRSAGHKTDRGRVYVLHGKPDNREIHPLEISTKPYEIWTYDRVEGGVQFVFVDRIGQGEFSLVHSTKRGEINQPNWYEMYIQQSRVSPQR